MLPGIRARRINWDYLLCSRFGPAKRESGFRPMLCPLEALVRCMATDAATAEVAPQPFPRKPGWRLAPPCLLRRHRKIEHVQHAGCAVD